MASSRPPPMKPSDVSSHGCTWQSIAVNCIDRLPTATVADRRAKRHYEQTTKYRQVFLEMDELLRAASRIILAPEGVTAYCRRQHSCGQRQCRQSRLYAQR